MPDGFILCTINVEGLCPNTPHKEGLEGLWKAHDKQEDKTILKDSLVLLARVSFEKPFLQIYYEIL